MKININYLYDNFLKIPDRIDYMGSTHSLKSINKVLSRAHTYLEDTFTPVEQELNYNETALAQCVYESLPEVNQCQALLEKLQSVYDTYKIYYSEETSRDCQRLVMLIQALTFKIQNESPSQLLNDLIREMLYLNPYTQPEDSVFVNCKHLIGEIMIRVIDFPELMTALPDEPSTIYHTLKAKINILELIYDKSDAISLIDRCFLSYLHDAILAKEADLEAKKLKINCNALLNQASQILQRKSEHNPSFVDQMIYEHALDRHEQQGRNQQRRDQQEIREQVIAANHAQPPMLYQSPFSLFVALQPTEHHTYNVTYLKENDGESKNPSPKTH